MLIRYEDKWNYCVLRNTVGKDEKHSFLVHTLLHESLSWTFQPLKMRPPRCLETSDTNHLAMSHHITEEWGPDFHIFMLLTSSQY
jgi:hypothetical protein